MRTLAFVAFLAVGVLCKPRWSDLEGYSFDQYVSDFHKSYLRGSSEYLQRKALFDEKLSDVVNFNRASHSYRRGVNHMSDWTAAELRSLKGRLPDSQVARSIPERLHVSSQQTLPDSKDYRMSFPPILTAVKDQGQCGSCWAHAATESIETHYAMHTGNLYVLSQQQITSCVNNSVIQCGGTGGCNGATAELAFDYVKEVGIAQEWTYSYTSYYGNSGVCNVSKKRTPVVVNISGYTLVMPRNNDTLVADALVNGGPLAISVDASSWSDYESGIFNGCDYAKNISMDHAVQLIGYGHDDELKMDYWLVRNSWSAGWGENGYIRLQRTTDCGYNVDWITNGGGCKGENNTVWACGMCGILYDTVYPNPR